MQRSIKPNVLKLPNGVRQESVLRAQETLHSFTRHLRELGSIDKAAEKASAENKAKTAEKKTK